MKQILVICALVGGCSRKKDDGNTGVVNPNKPSPKAVSEKLIANPILEKEIRRVLKIPTGELTEADLKKVTELRLGGKELVGKQLTEVPKGLEKLTELRLLYLPDNLLTEIKGLEKLTQLEKLYLSNNKLTEVKGLENLTQLTFLNLYDNPALTKAQIAQLQKALPKCKILSNAKK
jgi:Leucine-rich repeat (LRR) protein